MEFEQAPSGRLYGIAVKSMGSGIKCQFYHLRVGDLGQVPSLLCTSVSTAAEQDNYSSYHIDLLCGLNVLIHVEHLAQCLACGPALVMSAMV